MVKTQKSSRIIDNVIFAIFGFAGILLFFLIVNAFGLEEYPIIEDMYATDILFIILPVIAIILGVILSIEYRFKGNHGKAWIFFTLAIAIWFIGESTYSYDTEVDPQDISTLTSDIFYISGYPLFFIFTIFYLKSRSKMISRKTIAVAVILSATFAIPTLYLAIGIDEELSDFEVLLYGTYPLLNSLLLVPSIIAVSLFFRGHVGLLWLLMMMGIFTDIIANTIYLIQEIEGSYGVGNMVDVFFLWAYVFYSLGAWSFIKTYRDTIKQNQI